MYYRHGICYFKGNVHAYSRIPFKIRRWVECRWNQDASSFGSPTSREKLLSAWNHQIFKKTASAWGHKKCLHQMTYHFELPFLWATSPRVQFHNFQIFLTPSKLHVFTGSCCRRVTQRPLCLKLGLSLEVMATPIHDSNVEFHAESNETKIKALAHTVLAQTEFKHEGLIFHNLI